MSGSALVEDERLILQVLVEMPEGTANDELVCAVVAALQRPLSKKQVSDAFNALETKSLVSLRRPIPRLTVVEMTTLGFTAAAQLGRLS